MPKDIELSDYSNNTGVTCSQSDDHPGVVDFIDLNYRQKSKDTEILTVLSAHRSHRVAKIFFPIRVERSAASHTTDEMHHALS